MGWRVKSIVLKCPKCKREKIVRREPSDPKAACVVLILCPDCHRGEFGEARYFDDAGNELRPKIWEGA